MRIAVIVCSLLAPVVAASLRIDLQPAQMHQDLDVLKRALEEAHGGLYRFSTKAEVDSRFAAARSAVDRPLSTLAFIGVVSEAIAIVRDGHMRLEYDDATNAALVTARLLPLRVASEGGKIVVAYNDAIGDDTIRPGMELLSINGQPLAEITKAILARLSGDGFIETGKAWRMARTFAQSYWLFVDRTETFAVSARAADGRMISTTLKGITNAERAKSIDTVNAEAVSLSFPHGDGIGVLRVRAFDGDGFAASVGKAFMTLHDKVATSLIVDLRGNGGGVDQYGALLVSNFVTKPFRYFDHIKVASLRPSFATWKASTFEDLKNGTQPSPGGGFLVLPQLHPGVGEQRPATVPFLGTVIVLIDGGTFSTAADVSAQLRSLTKAVFIGEETGGGFEGNTSGLNAQVVLPNSGLKLKIQMYGYWNAVTVGQPGRGTLPDVSVVRRVQDVLQGIDPAMDKAIALARTK